MVLEEWYLNEVFCFFFSARIVSRESKFRTIGTENFDEKLVVDFLTGFIFLFLCDVRDEKYAQLIHLIRQILKIDFLAGLDSNFYTCDRAFATSWYLVRSFF